MALLFKQRKFSGLWLRKSLEDNPARFQELKNLRTTEDGPLRIRAGVKKPAPTGGSWSSSSPPVTGSATSKGIGGLDVRSPWPVILRRTAAGVFSEDLSQQAFMALFTAAATGERLYFLSPGGKFSSFSMYLGRAAADLTLTWKYTTSGADQTLTSVTDQLSSTGEKVISFVPPTSPNWAAGHFSGYSGPAVYVEITAVGGAPVIPRIAQRRISGDFPSRRTLILGSSDTQVDAESFKLWRYATQASPLETRFLQVHSSSGNLGRAGFDAACEIVAHDGAVYATNGAAAVRYQGEPVLNAVLGFFKPTSTGFNAVVGAAGNLTGTFRYGIRYGFGPNGAWGKGPFLASASLPVPGAQKVDVQFPNQVATLSAGIVDVVYVYRSVRLDGADAATYASQPFYEIAAVTRKDTDGIFPLNEAGGTGYTDNDLNLPFPSVMADTRDLTAPTNVKHMAFSANRLVLANSREHQARVWPSLPGNYEAFDQLSEFGFQDFAEGGGDSVTRIIDFAGLCIVFTERSMYALANLDREDWYPITIHSRIGCIAPASCLVAYGRLFWLAQDGFWMWDGENEPEPIGWPVQIEDVSPLVHGMSRAVAYNYGYEVELIPQNRGAETYATQWPSALYASLFTKYFYNLRTREWGQTEFANAEKDYMQPICTAEWPHHTDYEGRPAPVYMRHRVGDTVTDLRVWIGEAGVNDDGSALAYALTILYGPWESELMVPERWDIDALGLSTPTMAVSSATVLGEKPTIEATPAIDGSTDLTSYSAGFPQPGTGCAALALRASGTLTSATERDGYIYGIFLQGRKTNRKQPI